MTKKKIELLPGSTYTVEEFLSTLRKSKTGRKKFIKESGDGFYSYVENRRIGKEEVDILLDAFPEYGEKYGAMFNYFCTQFSPSKIYKKELDKDVADVKSNNIYDKMAAKRITTFEVGFEVVVSYNEPPIKVVHVFKKDTTLSSYEINSFM